MIYDTLKSLQMSICGKSDPQILPPTILDSSPNKSIQDPFTNRKPPPSLKKPHSSLPLHKTTPTLNASSLACYSLRTSNPPPLDHHNPPSPSAAGTKSPFTGITQTPTPPAIHPSIHPEPALQNPLTSIHSRSRETNKQKNTTTETRCIHCPVR